MVVESAEATHSRHRRIFDLIVQGIEVVAAARHAEPGAKRRRQRHANVFAGDIRADLLDWLEPRLPAAWSLADIANSGIELHGPDGVIICVRRPDSDGNAPGAQSERRGLMYSQPPLFTWVFDEPDTESDEPGIVMTVVATWGYNYNTSEVWLQLSAPSGADTWYWSEVDIDVAAAHDNQLAPDEEEHEDPLAGDDLGEEESDG